MTKVEFLTILISLWIIFAVLVVIYGVIKYFYTELKIKWVYKPSGLCPVQSEGYFLDYYFYFRARNEQAKIEFCKSKEDWKKDYITKEYILYKTNESYMAGYLSYFHCKRLIHWACFKFLINRIIRNFKDAI